MAIKFKARVLLELGAELISSDAVALYELVKNGLDAGSKTVSVEVCIAIQPSAVRRLIERWTKDGKAWNAQEFALDVAAHIEPTALPVVHAQVLKLVGQPKTLDQALKALTEATFELNSITVKDVGSGMTEKILVDSYLTIGTPGRMHEKQLALSNENVIGRLPLGEKGIGRLAAMRLGHYVMVYTGVAGESHWHGLELDWRPIFNLPDLDADALDFHPTKEASKTTAEHGTDIIIKDLQTDWTHEKLKDLWRTDMSKLSDPFENQYASRFLKLSFQGEKQQQPQPFDKDLLAYSDAYCRIDFQYVDHASGRQPRLNVQVEYRRFGAAVTSSYEGAHLYSLVGNPLRRKGRAKADSALPDSDEVVAALQSLGEFSAEFYWFNRGRIKRENNTLWVNTLEPFVSAWSGGLLVYRDGYRVYPYGAGSDDWLDLDRKALASSAYKLNRAQIVGRLSVSSRKNPRLKDQTNREGFRDSPEKEALRRLLRQAIIADCKSFLEKVDKDEKSLDPTTVSALDKKISASRSAATKALLSIQKRVPQEASSVQLVLAELSEVEAAWKRAKAALAQKGSQLEQYVHLAAVGLSVEFIAHELARSTENALELLGSGNVKSDPVRLESLRAQLKTINKRVRVLDDLSIPGRQIKSPQDLGEIAGVMAEVYEAKAKRHGIKIDVTRHGKPFMLRLERGQIMQILDNLMSNSMYWLERRTDRISVPKVSIDVDYDARKIVFSDNGPGIPTSIASRIYDAFYTTKPAGQGRGLGLAIVRQLAKENGAEIDLLPERDGVHRGFTLLFKD